MLAAAPRSPSRWLPEGAGLSLLSGLLSLQNALGRQAACRTRAVHTLRTMPCTCRRADAVDRHAVGAELGCQRARQSQQRVLGRAVGEQAGPTHMAHDRADVDDTPPAVPPHLSRSLLHRTLQVGWRHDCAAPAPARRAQSAYKTTTTMWGGVPAPARRARSAYKTTTTMWGGVPAPARRAR